MNNVKNKNSFDFEDDLNDIKDIKNVTLDLEEVKKNVPHFSSQKLCEMIVCDRYFGFEKKISVVCMEELAKRRLSGDNFDFETYIENSYNELPQLSFNIPDLRTVLNQAVKMRAKK